jgi:hypothetical protein
MKMNQIQYHNKIEFFKSDGMPSRKETSSLNAVNNGSADNCANNVTYTSCCGRSCLQFGPSLLCSQCEEYLSF